MEYDWVKIFKEKEENELIKIYAGDSHLDYEASIYAGLELKKRGFNFEKIEKIHNEKMSRLKMEIEEFKNLNFKNSKYFRDLLINLASIIIILFIFFKRSLKFQDEYNFYKILIYLVVTLIGILSAKWNYNRFKKHKQKTLELKIELIEKMTAPKNKPK